MRFARIQFHDQYRALVQTVLDLCLMTKDILSDLIQSDIPVVYMTRNIFVDGLMNACLSLNWISEGNKTVL